VSGSHWSLTEPVPKDLDRRMAAASRVHLVGVGGAGMSGIARLLLDRSGPVSGSDAQVSQTTAALAARGARISIGHRAAAVDGAGVVVVSSAVRENNPEVLAARAAGIPLVHRSVALAALMAADTAVTVTGTHGKTTTTSMITVAARACGLDVSYAIGADLAADGVNARLGTAGVFVAEADESDGSFRAYHPGVCVVGNVEADHLDHYGSVAAIEAAFASLAQGIAPQGLAIAGADDAGARRWAASVAAARADVRVLHVGRDPGNDVVITDLTARGGAVAMQVTAGPQVGGGADVSITLAVPGRHNATNAALAWTACVAGLGLDPRRVAAGLADFTGARRRFERRGTAAGVLVVDDYAHHPTEVRATISAARDVSTGGSVHVLFQPHLYSRTRLFAADFADALATADSVVALDVYAAREDPEPGVDGGLVIRGVAAGRFVPDRAAAVAAVAAAARPGDVVLTLGAGDVTELVPAVLDALGAAAPS